MKTCRMCGEEKSLSEFTKNKASKDGYDRYCSLCSIEKCRAYYYGHREKRLARIKQWRQENRLTRKVYKWNQKAKRYNAPGVLTVADYRAVIDLYGDRCLSCGAELAVLDHVVPLSAGGANDRSNLQPLCVKCNRDKGVKETDYRGLS